MVKAETQLGSRIQTVVSVLSQRNPDGSYVHSYPGDHTFLRTVYEDRLAQGVHPDRSVHSMYGQTKKAVDAAVKRLRRLAEGEEDPIGEQLLDLIRGADPRNANFSPADGIESLTRENPNGRHRWHNTEKQGPKTRRRTPQIERTDKRPIPRERAQVRRERHVQTYGFTDRARIQLTEPEVADIGPTRSSLVDSPYWPQDNLSQLEKYAYALELPGRDGDWHFQDLKAVVETVNRSSLKVNLNGYPLTPVEKRQKTKEMVEGAKVMLRTYVFPVLRDNIPYLHDPIHNREVPELAKKMFDWLRRLPEDKRPTLDSFLSRMDDALAD